MLSVLLANMAEAGDNSEHTVSNKTAEDLEIEPITADSGNTDHNSDFDILEESPNIHKEIELCEDDMLKRICYQILDRIEFEHVPNAERDALCRIIMNRGLMDLKEGRVTSPFQAFSFEVIRVQTLSFLFFHRVGTHVAMPFH